MLKKTVEKSCETVKNKKTPWMKVLIIYGGSTGARTPDLVHVKDAL